MTTNGIAIGIGVIAIIGLGVASWRIKLFFDERAYVPRYVCPVCRHLMVHTGRSKFNWYAAVVIWIVGLAAAGLLATQSRELALVVSWLIWLAAILYIFITERRVVRRCSVCGAMGVLPVESRRGNEICARMYEEVVDEIQEFAEIDPDVIVEADDEIVDLEDDGRQPAGEMDDVDAEADSRNQPEE